MKREKKNNVKEMWKNPQSKAILKLGMWGIFFCLMALTLAITSVNNNREEKNIQEPKEETKEEFLSLETIWHNLEMANYRYLYQIRAEETDEIVTYQGEMKENTEVGFRESKIGIVKYKIQEGKTYQILLDAESEIESVYEAEDIPYIRLDLLKTLLDPEIEKQEEQDDYRVIIYQKEAEEIKITTTSKKILEIDITTNQKTYHLTYEYEL